MLAFIGTIGIQELLIIFLILMLLFGASKLPLLGKGLGEGIRNFKKGLRNESSNQALDESAEAEDKVSP